MELNTDAAAVGIAGMLLQPDAAGRLQLVRCVSRKCNHVESAYHSARLELLAITFAMEFRPFLVGRKFTLVTDCQALLSINTGSTRSRQLARWSALVQEFQFSVVHRAGERMAHVNGLSRNPTKEPGVANERIYCGASSDGGQELEIPSVEWRDMATSPPLTFEAEVRAIQGRMGDFVISRTFWRSRSARGCQPREESRHRSRFRKAVYTAVSRTDFFSLF